jgi:hypothetical protein
MTVIQRMWNLIARMIPLTIWATGTISNSLRKHVSNTPGKNEFKKSRKAAIFSTTHILQEELFYKFRTYFTGAITVYVAQTVTTEQLQH